MLLGDFAFRTLPSVWGRIPDIRGGNKYSLCRSGREFEFDMTRWPELNEETRAKWDTNAENWDRYMGDEGNSFHMELVRPATERLLKVGPGSRVLDIGCGNGNFSRRLVQLGARVMGIDFSQDLIERTRARSEDDEHLRYLVVDATDHEALVSLGQFDAAAANMVLMDMSTLSPLASALPELLKPGAPFVFSVSHPCFQTPDTRRLYEERDEEGQIISGSFVQIGRYITPESHEGSAIPNEPVPSRYFHRPLSTLLQHFFDQGLMLDGMQEPTFSEAGKDRFEWTEIPPVLVCRIRRPPV